MLAAYRKYGSRAPCLEVCANQACSIVALAETARKGRPKDTAKSSHSQGAGNVVAGGIQPCATWIGRTIQARLNKPMCSTACRRGPSHFSERWAYKYPAKRAAW